MGPKEPAIRKGNSENKQILRWEWHCCLSWDRILKPPKKRWGGNNGRRGKGKEGEGIGEGKGGKEGEEHTTVCGLRGRSKKRVSDEDWQGF